MDFHVAVPGPFTYLVQEHARSIIAIQELQQEVTSLLAFRDHVLDALPHLHSRPFHSLTPAPTHDPPPAPRAAHTPAARSEASPSKAAHAHLSGGEGGGRQQQQRVLSAGGGGGGGSGGGGNSSSSSTGGGKSLSETHSSSAVADSGFSTDKAGGSMGKTSSSSSAGGDHLSGALSGADEPRWTSVEPDPPLGSAEDELWHLLDVIQRKGTRLRHELERAERCERDRLLAGHHHAPPAPPAHPHLLHHLHQPAAPASDPLSSPRHAPPPAAARDYWPHSLPGPTAADLLPPPPPPPPPVGVALEAEAWAAVDRLRQDRQYLIGRVGWAEAEAAASHQRLVDLHGQLLALAGDKRRLEDQVRALRLDAARPDAPNPLSPIITVPAAGQLGGGGGAVTIVTGPSTTTTTTTARPRRASPAVTVSVAGPDAAEDAAAASGAGRGRGVRSASSVRLNTDRDRDVVLPRVLKVPIKERGTRAAAPPPAAATATAAATAGVKEEQQQQQEEECDTGRGSDRVVIERERRAGRADGGFSMPVSLLKGARVRVTPNKQRISAILREKDVLELQRQLLTTVMEAEVLRKQIESAGEEWASKTSQWEADHRHAHAALATLRDENTRLKQQLEARPRAEEQQHRDMGVSACPAMFTRGTMTTVGGAGVEEAPTHTVHAGPNVKYDVVVHQEERRGEGVAGVAGVKKSSAGVEKPPRRTRDPRSTASPGPSPAPPLREAAESPGARDSRDSLGRVPGVRGRAAMSQSGRCTPTGSTPRSSPAPSITPRMCTARAAPQDPARASPLSRGGGGTTGTVTRATLGRRDSLKAAQTKGGGGKACVGGAGGGVGGVGVQAKVAPPLSPDQGGVRSQPRPMRHAAPAPRSPRSPRSPLTLHDLRTPSPAPAPENRTRGARTLPGRKLGVAGAVLYPREAVGAGQGAGAGARRTPSPGVRRGRSVSASPAELRLSHLDPASPSPSPPASCSSYYDSINSEGPPACPSPAPDRLMQVEVAFEWSPVSTQGSRQPRPDTQHWHPTPAPYWPPSPRLTHGAHSPSPGNSDTARPWPPDSLEGPEVEYGAAGHGGAHFGATSGAGVRGRVEGSQGRPVTRPAPRPMTRPASRPDQDLNTRVHQILTRIASGAP